MPTMVDKLTKDSSEAQIKAAISDCMAYHMKMDNLTQEQAAGKCYGMMRDKTGRQEMMPQGGK